MRISEHTKGMVFALGAIALAAIFALVMPHDAHPQTTVGIGAIGDPCLDARITKSNASVNISTATTTAIVAVSGTTSVYVCAWSLQTTAGTTPTIQFEYGTGAACAGGPTVLTGTYGGNANQLIPSPGTGITLLKTASSNGLCIVTTGTGPNIQGFVTFIQQ